MTNPTPIHTCPTCGAVVVRLGGSWISGCKYFKGEMAAALGGITIRVEVCLNASCKWTRKLYRFYPSRKWIVVP